MRGGEHPVSRVLKKNNLFSFQARGRYPNQDSLNTYIAYDVNPEGRRVAEDNIARSFEHKVYRVEESHYEIPVTNRFKPLSFAYFVPSNSPLFEAAGDDDPLVFENKWVFKQILGMGR